MSAAIFCSGSPGDKSCRLSEGDHRSQYRAIAYRLDRFTSSFYRVSRRDHRLHVDHALFDQFHVTWDVAQHVQSTLLAGVERPPTIRETRRVEAHVAAPCDAEHDDVTARAREVEALLQWKN